jgi:hypothetical protein
MLAITLKPAVIYISKAKNPNQGPRLSRPGISTQNSPLIRAGIGLWSVQIPPVTFIAMGLGSKAWLGKIT